MDILCLRKPVEGWNPVLTKSMLETRSEPWLRKGREGSQSKTGNRKLLKSSFKGISVSSSLLRLYFLQGCFCLLWPHSPPTHLPTHCLKNSLYTNQAEEYLNFSLKYEKQKSLVLVIHNFNKIESGPVC